AGWDDDLVLMSGMVGSRQGWREAPYVNCPAGEAELRKNIVPVEAARGRSVFIVPGLSCIDSSGVPDVMRGEETQILGALDELPHAATVCLPGTHSKWARVRDGRIESFATFFTGELFAVLCRHSLLGRMMEEGAPSDEAAFAEGVERSGEASGLLHHLFGVRTRTLFSELSPRASPSYLSGLLIGHELRSAAADEVFLLGAPALAERYARAALYLGLAAKTLDPHAAARGLYRLGRSLNRT
ncbi:MAG: 2-dehydro-3-deoxygalactonokinase, partial [Betaproteobacteria bacterium]|nr:2-dehydro-3-deoxygalactonokinase [Betaproteobacteria bacterium]